MSNELHRRAPRLAKALDDAVWMGDDTRLCQYHLARQEVDRNCPACKLVRGGPSLEQYDKMHGITDASEEWFYWQNHGRGKPWS
jgi:hypothetical protein